MFRNSNYQGNAGLSAAIYHFSSRGYPVCLPLTDSQSFDLVVEIDGKLSKIQVKTTSDVAKDGKFKVELRTKGGNKTGTGKTKRLNHCDIDFLFVFTSAGQSYLIPADELRGSSNLLLGPFYNRYLVCVLPVGQVGIEPLGIHPTYITPPILQTGVGSLTLIDGG